MVKFVFLVRLNKEINLTLNVTNFYTHANMSGASYNPDDIGALVVDLGSHTCKIGYCGDEVPIYDIPTHYASYLKPNHCHKNLFGTVAIHSRTPDAEMLSFLRDGMIEDFDVFEEFLEYIFSSLLYTDSKIHPVLLSEPVWALRTKREQLIELMFEKFSIPAFQLGKTPVLAAIAHTRPTCLVLDSGSTHTTAVPIHEGMIIPRGLVKCISGGNAVIEKINHMLIERNIHVVPYYRVASKEVVEPDQPAIYVEKSHPVHPSWHNYMVREALQDFQTDILQIPESPYEEENMKNIPKAHFEFPNGYHTDFGSERFQVAESFYTRLSRIGNGIQPICDLSSVVANSIAMCDTELRPVLYGNILLTGGNTKIPGFVERLTRDLQAKVPPSMRLKVVSQWSNFDHIDRRFFPWIGGSIITSLARFQSLWISKQLYDERGKSVDVINIKITSLEKIDDKFSFTLSDF